MLAASSFLLFPSYSFLKAYRREFSVFLPPFLLPFPSFRPDRKMRITRSCGLNGCEVILLNRAHYSFLFLFFLSFSFALYYEPIQPSTSRRGFRNVTLSLNPAGRPFFSSPSFLFSVRHSGISGWINLFSPSLSLFSFSFFFSPFPFAGPTSPLAGERSQHPYHDPWLWLQITHFLFFPPPPPFPPPSVK